MIFENDQFLGNVKNKKKMKYYIEMSRELYYGVGLISFFAIAVVMLRQSTMLENYTSEIYDGNFDEIEKSEPFLENIEFEPAPTIAPHQVQ